MWLGKILVYLFFPNLIKRPLSYVTPNAKNVNKGVQIRNLKSCSMVFDRGSDQGVTVHTTSYRTPLDKLLNTPSLNLVVPPLQSESSRNGR